jgi:hypothetical protein
MINPDDYWVNNPRIAPMNKAMFYDMDIWKAEQDGQDKAIDIFNEATGHIGKTHYYGMECWFCAVVEKIKEYKDEDTI